MMFRISITAARLGADALVANPLRALLSTLGVIIGVASLVAVLSLGDGMEATVRSEIARLTDVQTVSVSPKTTETIDGQSLPVRQYPVFAPRDAADAAATTGAAAVSLVTRSTISVDDLLTGKRHLTSASGVIARADEFYHLAVAAGRFFTDAEAARGASVIVLSHKLAEYLAAGMDATRVVGHMLRIRGSTLAVIGVLAPYDGEVGYDVYLPFAVARRVFPPMDEPWPATILLRAASIETVDALAAAAQDWVAQHYARRLEKLEVTTQQSQLARATQGMLILKLFMAALTGISLLVGGVGIMNIMLASVVERTREIGVRKAIGARSRDILLQFLAESVTISGAGSAIGVALGVAMAFATTIIIRVQAHAPFVRMVVSWLPIASAIVCALLIGLIFGTYPALRAARLSPIDAIRHE